jgi:hypothetical protein
LTRTETFMVVGWDEGVRALAAKFEAPSATTTAGELRAVG